MGRPLTHGDNVANNVVSKGQVACDGNKNVDTSCRANAGADNRDDPWDGVSEYETLHTY